MAGSVDFVAKAPDGSYVIVDWKRSAKFDKHLKNPMVNEPFTDIPDSNFGKYALQLNLYKLILKEKYDIDVSKMYVVLLHSRLNSYQVEEICHLDLQVEDGKIVRAADGPKFCAMPPVPRPQRRQYYNY